MQPKKPAALTRFAPRNFRLRPERLVLALSAAVLTLILLSFGWLEVAKVARRKIEARIDQTSRTLGIKIAVGRILVTPAGVRLEDVRIGEETDVVISQITAQIGLNPFGGSFGTLDTVVADKVRVKSPLAEVRGTAENLEAAGLLAASGGGAKTQHSLEKLFQALPTRQLYVRSAVVTLLDQAGQPRIIFKGLRLLIAKQPSKMLFRVDRVSGPDGILDRNVQGRFELNPTAPGYRFFVRRKVAPGSHRNAWAVSGVVRKDFGGAALDFELMRLPTWLAKRLTHQLDRRSRLALKAHVDVLREADGYHLVARAQSAGARILVPLVSSRPVGPILFSATAKATLRPTDHLLALESASISLPVRRGGHLERAPVRLSLAANLHWPSLSGGDFSIKGDLQLPSTACQTVLDASPKGLLPALAGFKLTGDASLGVSFTVDDARPDSDNFSLHDARFGCQVVVAPYAYSAARLKGPFTLQRTVGEDKRPLTITVSPASPTYTPIAQIARDASLAFVASEDASFYTHRGIEPAAIEGALKRDLAERRIAVGGSTITMQTVKNLFLTPERTLSRKLQELFLAWHVENVLSKERILEIYLNIVEFGPGIYGIDAASERFFGKRPADLNLLESAYLASLLPAPKARYRYFCAGHMSPNFTELVHGLLHRMLNLGRVDEPAYLQAMAATLHFSDLGRAAAKDCNHSTAEAEAASPYEIH